MKRSGNKNEHNEIWKPFSDLWSVIVLMLLLILMLFLLHANFEDPDEFEEDNIGMEEGDDLHGIDDEGEGKDDEEGDTFDDHEHDHDYDYPQPQIITNGAGGGGGEEGDSDGTGGYEEEGVKSAVYVVLVDAETDRTIKEAGVTFELYGSDNALQVLNTYYPEKISYRDYETTEAGTFYLPEKIWPGEYYFHELTEPSGYDKSENVGFTIDQLYDWPEPYVVKIPAYPSRNIIRIERTDAATGAAIAGGTFEVFAAEDILTLDGTLRYKAGELVDTITCDENGYGESIELYLGNYTVKEKVIPEYYAGIPEVIDALVEKKTEVQPDVHKAESERTTISFRLTDELYPERGLAGAEFSVYTGDGLDSKTIATDEQGYIVLDEVKKNTTYHFKQQTAPENYVMPENAFDVTISADGRMNGSALYETSGTNRIIRTSIALNEFFTGAPIPEESMSLFTESGEVVKTWATTGSALTIEGLEPGNYYITTGKDQDKHYPVNIENTAQVQTFAVTKVTAKSVIYIVLATAGSIGALAGLIAGIRALIRKRKEKKGTEGERHE